MDEKEKIKLIAATVENDIEVLQMLFQSRSAIQDFIDSKEFEEIQEVQKDVAVMKRIAIDAAAMAFQLYIGTFGGFVDTKTDTGVS